jgi:hypothetical protein
VKDAAFIRPDPAQLARLHVSCDGKWPGIPVACFTDRDPSSPAFGASFDLRLPINIAALISALATKREQFAVADGK